jgi:hypothetical protein
LTQRFRTQRIICIRSKRKDLVDLDKAIARSEQDLTREVKGIANLTGDIQQLRDHKCNTCGQDLHDSKHEELLGVKESKLKDAETQQGVHAGDLEALIALAKARIRRARCATKSLL